MGKKDLNKKEEIGEIEIGDRRIPCKLCGELTIRRENGKPICIRCYINKDREKP